MVVEDVPADDSPLRPALAPVVRVRCRRRHPGVRCGRKCPECDDGGGDGDGATRTSAAMGSSSWAWRRARRARSMAWWSPECRGRSRAAGSPGISGWGMRGRWRPPTRRPWADSHASRAGRPAISRAGSRRPLGILDAVHVRRSHRDGRGRDQLREGGTRASPWPSTISANGSSGRTTDTARRRSARSSDSRPTSGAPPYGSTPTTAPNGSTPA